MKQISVLIADDQQVFVEGVLSVLNRNPAIEVKVIGKATDGPTLMETLTRFTPDVLLLDLNIAREEGLDIIPKIRKKYRDQRIIVLTTLGDSLLANAARNSGAKGFVPKNCSRNELISAIQTVAGGREYFSEIGTDAMERQHAWVQKYRQQSLEKFVEDNKLTKREVEVFRLIGRALSNKEIGDELFISDQTVSVHRKNIMRKLGVNNSAGLVKLAYDNCLI